MVKKRKGTLAEEGRLCCVTRPWKHCSKCDEYMCLKHAKSLKAWKWFCPSCLYNFLIEHNNVNRKR